MYIQDDRTDEQKTTLTYGVVGTDKFMSGWGKAKNGMSYAVWACKPTDIDKVERYVRSRSDMLRVRVVDLRTYRPTASGHCHIYAERITVRGLPSWSVSNGL